MIDRRSVLFGIPFGTLTIIGGQANAGVSITGEVHAAMQRFKDRWHRLQPYGVLMRDLNETMSKLAVEGRITGFTTKIDREWQEPRRMKCGSLVQWADHCLRVRFKVRGSDTNHIYKLIL